MRKNNIVVFLVISIFILVVSRFVGIFISRAFWGSETSLFIEKSMYKLVLLMFVCILVNKSKNNLAYYGFQKPLGVSYLKIILITILVTIISIPLNSIIFLGILRNFIKSNGVYPEMDVSLPIIILSIWIWSTLVEEVFVRGYIQSNLNFIKHKQIRIFKLTLSIPVLISALFFALMHISNIIYGYDLLYSLTMIFNAFWIGLVAAYFRENHASIYPAFVVHFTVNVIGTLPKLIKLIA